MKNNEWKFIGVIGQVHDLDAKKLIFETHEIQHKHVVRHVVDMHNRGESLKAIDTYLLDANCTTEEREYIVEAIWKHFDSEYEFRGVFSEGDGVQSLPLDQINVGGRHELISIGLYRNLNDGTQEHIRDIDHLEIKKWNGLFMGLRYKS